MLFIVLACSSRRERAQIKSCLVVKDSKANFISSEIDGLIACLRSLCSSLIVNIVINMCSIAELTRKLGLRWSMD